MESRYDPKASEPRWQRYWEQNHVYSFRPGKGEIYSIDTPPPTVSGKMHIGHAFSYTQLDFIARFQRMQGKSIFFPFGTDDNGIATERLIEKTQNVRAVSMDRKAFTRLCLDTLKSIRPGFVEDWKRIGMSCDWSVSYSTIDKASQKISQKSFIDLYNAGREYRKDAPALYCPDCRTAVSQVECEDALKDSFFNDIVFRIDGEEVIIATTRPEYLPATVAVFYNPGDERYSRFRGKKARVPLFDFEVPVLPDPRADPEKGTGLVMCCTFGDQTDMEWYFAHELPLKSLVTREGRLTEIAGRYAGMAIHEARRLITADLKKAGLLLSQKPIQHAVKVHERCKGEIEIIHTKQWFIKYLDLREDMLRWGRELNWFPEHMRVRYDNWVRGLQWDWLISRQRFHGIPFPVWYCADCSHIVLAETQQLPVDPAKDRPLAEACPKCNCRNFVPDNDVMDTWATSSLSPQLAIERYRDKPFYSRLFPMSLRPQAHDIITFWLFNTVVKSQLHHQVNPWRDVAISGHALDPIGKKMSKSKGNIVEPQAMVEKYCADALRFWAAGSKLGDDMPFQEKDLVTGMKFITKLWNASRFVLGHLHGCDVSRPAQLQTVDLWLLSRLHRVISSATASFSKYEYSKTKLETEKFFWHTFCDYYLELVKDRLYNQDRHTAESIASAKYALQESLLAVLKLMAPIMPHITEEIYHLHFAALEKSRSIHLAPWPASTIADENAEQAGELVVYAMDAARKAKTDRQISLKSPLKKMVLKSKHPSAIFAKVRQDVMAATSCMEIEYVQLEKESTIDFEHVIDI